MIVADTHVWLWWISDTERLSAAALEALGSGPVGVSPFTFWEVAMLDRKRRVKLDGPALPWIAEAVDRSHTVTIELSLEIAVIAGSFDHARLRDPADRIIVATALHHGWPLVTKDDDIRAAGVVPTIW